MSTRDHMIQNYGVQFTLQKIMALSGTDYELVANDRISRAHLRLGVAMLISALPALLHLYFLTSAMLIALLVYLLISASPDSGKPLPLIICMAAGAACGLVLPIFFLDNWIAICVLLALITIVYRIKRYHISLSGHPKCFKILAYDVLIVSVYAAIAFSGHSRSAKSKATVLIVFGSVVAFVCICILLAEIFKHFSYCGDVTQCVDLCATRPDEPIVNLIRNSSCSTDRKIDPEDIKKRTRRVRIAQILAAAILLAGILTGENIRFTMPAAVTNDYASYARIACEVPDFEFEFELTKDGAVLKACKAASEEPTTCTVPDTWQDQPVTEIGEGAFCKFTHLEKVVLPETVKEIGNSAFSGCSQLKDINLPAGLEKIHAFAFYNCVSLANVDLPDTLISLGAYAFNGCKISAIRIPDGITELHEGAFCKCASLKSVQLPDGLKKLGDKCFYECSALYSISLPDSVRSLGEYCFYNCKALQSIRIPKGVDRIKPYTFASTGLKSITVPEGVYKISSHAFYQCKSLSTVYLPFSLRTIGSSAFRECGGIEVHKSMRTSVNSKAFKDTYASTSNDVTLLSVFSGNEPAAEAAKEES